MLDNLAHAIKLEYAVPESEENESGMLTFPVYPAQEGAGFRRWGVGGRGFLLSFGRGARRRKPR